MFAGRFTSSIGPIGIDFGAGGVKMLQLREHAGKLQVVGASRIDGPLPAAPKGPVKPAAKPHDEISRTKPAAKPLPVRDEYFEPADPAVQLDNDRLTNQIRAACSSSNFIGRKCVVSLAREDVSVQSIRLPKMPDDELRQSAVWEASQRFGFDRTAMEVDFIRTGATLASGENREEVILLAASHAAIHARLNPVLAAGLRPVAVDTGFAALVRTFSRQVRREADRGVVRAVVEIGSTGTTVLVLRGDQIAFCKPITISGAQFSQAVADHLQMDLPTAAELRSSRIAAVSGASLIATATATASSTNAESSSSQANSVKPVDPGQFKQTPDTATDRAVYEAVRPLMGELVKEVTLCLRYYGVTFRGHPPERIVLTGGDGLEPNLGEMMAKACKTPVVFDDSSSLLSGLIGQIQTKLNRTPGPAACWAVPVGLGLRGCGKKLASASSEQTGGSKRGAAAA